ncbi:MAG: YcaO-like family protein [Bryobacteraceae bacterium]|nr:YcaO-like family protein [Bryobacteraceae bacterium]
MRPAHPHQARLRPLDPRSLRTHSTRSLDRRRPSRVRPARLAPLQPLPSLARRRRSPHLHHADTNGCAAAPTLAEAQFRALLELVERDAVGIWWYNRLRRPEIPIHLLDHIPSVAAALPSLPTLQRSLHFLDVTTDLAVPAVVAVLARLDGSQPFFGAAAHPDPAIAVTKALRESVQFMFWAQTEHAAPDVKAASIHRHPWLRPHGSAPVPAPLPLKNVGDLVRHLARHHLNAYAVDMTRPEIGLPVARTIVPGLVHHWSRFAQRRLYEVPVRMGWLPNPLAESELNPWNCPL